MFVIFLTSQSSVTAECTLTEKLQHRRVRIVRDKRVSTISIRDVVLDYTGVIKQIGPRMEMICVRQAGFITVTVRDQYYSS